jgi:hypothetical protein
MATFKFKFSRRVVQYDEFEREIEAPDLATAQRAADNEANHYNHDCPDDCAPGDYLELGDFDAEHVEPD